jgi:hypothetical protein
MEIPWPESGNVRLNIHEPGNQAKRDFNARLSGADNETEWAVVMFLPFQMVCVHNLPELLLNPFRRKPKILKRVFMFAFELLLSLRRPG